MINLNLYKPANQRFIFLFLIIFIGIYSLEAQVVNLPCQTEVDGFLGLDRKNWNGGSTAAHSEGSLHNFDLPLNTFGDCKKISNVSIEITAISADLTNLPADCGPPGAYYINIASPCADFSPASCDVANLIAEPNSPNFISQSLSYNSPPEDFQFGDNLAIDIVPVMNVNCTNGQSALTNGSIVLDYEICVTVTIVDEDITTPVNIGGPSMACPVGTTTIAVGPYDEYEWGPGGENTQTIDVGPGTYNVTVTDLNGCTDTDQIVILALPDSPITFDPAAPTVCDNGFVNVSVVESYNSYAWSNALSGQTVSLSTGVYDVTITDNNNCTAVNTVTVTSIPPPEAGNDLTIISACEGTTIDLTTLLSPLADAGGVFSDPSGSGALTGSTVNTTGLAGQTIDFIYTVGLPSDPCGTDEATIRIMIESENNAGDDNSTTVCDDVTIDLNTLLSVDADAGGVFSDPGATGALTGTMVNTSTLGGQSVNFIYTVGQPTDACGQDVATLTLIVEASLDAGDDNSGNACDGDFFDLTTLLSADADIGGVFSDPSSSGSLSGSTVNTLGLGGQTINFIYTVGLPSDACGDDQSTLTLTIDEFLFAGDDNSVTVCDGEMVNLNDLLDPAADVGGIFLDFAATGSLTGFMVNTTGFAGQTLDFVYEVGMASNACGIDQSTLTVIVVDAVDAGDDNSITACEGTTIDLFDLLSIDADFDGTFSDPSGSGSLIGSLVNTTGLAGQSIDYIYEVGDALDPCGVDQATLTIVIETSLQAGDDNSVEECLGGTINLDNYLINADLGGMYNDLNGSGGLSGNMLNTDAITIGQYTYEYVVGDGITCPFDTSEISILFIEMPNVTFETDTIELCYEVCQPISIAISGGVDFQFDLSVQDANGAAQGNTTLTSDIDIFSIYLCNDQTNIGFANDTLNFSNQDSLLLQIENVSSDVCASDIVDSLWITSLPQNIFELDTSICIFDTLTINGQEFFLGNSTYIDTLDGIACDSFININVSFDDADTTFILETICLGDSTNYFSTWYSEANPSGVLNVETDSGCDSVFVIDISFYEVADSLIDLTLCEGDFLEINGTVFDESNPVGEVIYFDGAANGCDSIVNVSLQFGGGINISRTDTLCEGSSIVIGGSVFDESNNPNQLTVPGVDCDTIFDINLTFTPPTTNTISGIFCSDFDTIVNGNIYDINNPVDTEIITGGNYLGCDSIIIVDLQFNNGVEIVRTDTLCEGESIVIGGTIIDENNNPTQLIVPGVDCDTTFNIDLTFTAPTTNSITGIFCSDFDTLVNGVIYDINNASNTDIITGGNYLGCDSIIIIDLQFNNGIEVTRTDTLCEGESIVIGGTIIDESNNPTQLIVPGVDCDTTINVDLTFAAVSTNPITGTFCSDFDTLINGNLYNMLNPADTEIITGGNYLGCDSIIIVDLSFTPCDIDVAVTAVGNNCVGESQGAFNVQINSPVDIPYIIVLEEISSGELTNINVSVEQTNYQFENLSSGAYNISVIDNTGATLYTTTEDINDLFPELTGDWSLIDTIFCNGDEAQLEFLATGGMLDYNYAWSESQVGDSPLASDLSAGIYQVTVTDMNGCTFDSSYEITEPLPISFTVNETDVTCDGNNGTIEVINIEGGVLPYTILLDDVEVGDAMVSDLAPGNYTVQVMDDEGCESAIESVTILESGVTLLADYVLDYTIDLGDSVDIVGQLLEDNLTFDWLSSASLSCEDCPDPTAFPITPTVYDLIITDDQGCEQEVTITVNVESNIVVIAVPNIFSPNNDGINDEFIFGNEDLLAVELTVFDRWGNQMHNQVSIDGYVRWDGKTNGNPLQSGVYVYQILCQLVDGRSEVRIGDVTIVR